MPWKQSAQESAQQRFARRRLKVREPFKTTCQAFGISRKTGYKWWRRVVADGLNGVRPRPTGRQAWQAQVWKKQVMSLRRRYRFWGARKLRSLLAMAEPRPPLPAEKTLQRWLGARLRKPRRGRGPRLVLVRIQPTEPNAVWTVDFKGWFRTGDGTRTEPLTVRDLHSRLVLLVRHLPAKDHRAVRHALTRLFRRRGLPRAMRMDNGPPFGGTGPLGWTRLSVWLRQLGIQVEFSRPARPGDNAEHEHLHGELQRETAQPPAANPAAQQKRFDRWVKLYNTVRPHESLHQATPASVYRDSPRRLPARLPAWPTHSHAAVRRVSAGGWIWYQGKKRLIGRAFAGQPVALHALDAHHCEIFLGPHLLGWLWLTETLIRAAHAQLSVQGREGAAPPPLQPSPSLQIRTKPRKINP